MSRRKDKPELTFEEPQGEAHEAEAFEGDEPVAEATPAPTEECTHTHSDKMNGLCQHT